MNGKMENRADGCEAICLILHFFEFEHIILITKGSFIKESSTCVQY